MIVHIDAGIVFEIEHSAIRPCEITIHQRSDSPPLDRPVRVA